MINSILDEIKNNNILHTENEVERYLNELKKSVLYLRNKYRKYPIDNLDYSPKPVQEAYLLAYFMHYTLPVSRILSDYYTAESFPDNELKISLVGGGPCPEIFGVMNFLDYNNRLPKKVSVRLLDRYADQWTYSHNIIKKVFRSKFPETDVKIDIVPFELTSGYNESMVNEAIRFSDVFIVQNILNEIPTSHQSSAVTFLGQLSKINDKTIVIISELYASNARNFITDKLLEFPEKNSEFRCFSNVGDKNPAIVREDFTNAEIRNHLMTGENFLRARKVVRFRFLSLTKDVAFIEKVLEKYDKINLLDIIKSYQSVVKDSELDSEIFVGIDFGTSTSYACLGKFNHEAGAFIFENLKFKQKGYNTGDAFSERLDSVVAFVDDKNYVGKGALDFSTTSSAVLGNNLWTEFKLSIGTESDLFPENSTSTIIKSPNDVSKYFIDYMFNDIRGQIKNVDHNKVSYRLSIPASYDVSQRRAYAGIINEFEDSANIDDMIDEPNAALLSFLNDHSISFENSNSNILVFDYGAGTCDVSIVKLENSHEGIKMKNLAVSPFSKLGGHYTDKFIAREILLPQFFRKFINFMEPEMAKELEENIFPKLIVQAKILKEKICKSVSLKVSDIGELPDIAFSDEPQKHKFKFRFNNERMSIQFNLSYRNLSEIMKSIFNNELRYYTDRNSIYNILSSTIKLGGLKPDEIDEVVYIGGSSENPYIRNMIGDFLINAKCNFPIFGNSRSRIAEGTAIYGYLSKKFMRPVIQPIIAKDLSIVVDGFEPLLLFSSGSEIPTGNFIVRFKLKNGQRECQIPVLSGDDIIDNLFFNVDGLEEGDSEIIFQIDELKKLSFDFIHNNETMKSESRKVISHISDFSGESILSAKRKEFKLKVDSGNIPDESVIFELADAYSKAFEFNRAISLVNAFYKNPINENHLIACLKLGEYNMYNFNFAKADLYISAAHRIDSNNENVLFVYADMLYRRNLIKDYETTFHNTIVLFPKSYKLLRHYASFLKRKGDDNIASEYSKKCLEVLQGIVSPTLPQMELIMEILEEKGEEDLELRKRIIEYKNRAKVDTSKLIKVIL